MCKSETAPIYTRTEDDSLAYGSLIFSCAICGSCDDVVFSANDKKYCSDCFGGMIEMLAEMYRVKIDIDEDKTVIVKPRGQNANK